MRIAIVGSGVAGLSAAWRLHRRHDVTVFEARDRVGGHVHTARFEYEGAERAVDTGFIVFNERNYPLFTALLRRLGVESQATAMSFSVRRDSEDLEYNGTSLNRLFARRSNLFRPSFLRMVAEIPRFNREATADLDGLDDETTVREYVARRGYGREFAENYLIPLGTSLWSSPARRFEDFPVKFVIEFLANHGMLGIGGRPQWRVVRGGSDRYVEALIRPFRERIRTGTKIVAVERLADHVRLVDQHGAEGRFDHVVLACHADQALAALRDPTRFEREALAAFPYQPNDAVLHTDVSVLPRRKLAWASWNCRAREDAEGEAVAITYNMNLLQGLAARPVFNVTLNDDAGIDPAKIIRRLRYSHPLYTRARSTAQATHRELANANRTSYCGAYWGYGFHEDGVRSGFAAAAAIDKALVEAA